MPRLIARLGSLTATAALAAAIAFAASAPTASAAPAAVAATSGETLTQAAPPRVKARAARMLVVALVRNTAELTGKERADVVAALRSGQSLAQFAAANGSSGEAVVAAVVDKARERLDKAVERGRITAEQAAQALAEITTKATELVNDATLGERLPGPRP